MNEIKDYVKKNINREVKFLLDEGRSKKNLY